MTLSSRIGIGDGVGRQYKYLDNPLTARCESCVFSTVINVLLLVMPIYMIQVYDRVLPAASGNTLVYLSIMAVAALGFLGLIETIRAVYFLRIAASIDRQLASGAFEAALSGPRADSGDGYSDGDFPHTRVWGGRDWSTNQW